MSVLVEFHNEANLARVLASGADLIGINNRDLRHFHTDLEHTLRLRDQIPPEVTVVSESGIRTRRDVERLEAAGISAILVGESLLAPIISVWQSIASWDVLLTRPPSCKPFLGFCYFNTLIY